MALSVDNGTVGLTVGTPANGVALSTGSFTPPNNSLLLVPVEATSNSSAPDITISVSGGGLSWTKITEQEGVSSSYGGHVSYWGALVTTGASMTIDITRTAGDGGVNGIVTKPLIITGHDTTTPWAAKNKGNTTTNNPTLSLGNSAANNSRFFYAAFAEPDNGGAPTSTDTIDANTYAGAADVAFCFKAADTAVSGTAVSGNVDFAGTSSVGCTWASVEVYTSGSVPSSGVTVSLTGQASSAQAGSLTQGFSYALSGQAATAAAGSVTYNTTGAVTLTLAGQAAAAQAGTLTQSRSYAVSGASATAQTGTLSARWQATVGWTDIVGEDGYRVKWGTAPDTYTASADLAADTTSYTITGLLFNTTYYTRTYGLLSGVEQGGSIERALTQNDVTVSLSGSAVTASSGTLGYGWSRSATGQLATISAGAMSTSRTLAPTGAAATAQTGTLAANTSGGVTAALTGAEATSSAGTVSEGLSLALTGLQITATPGSVSASSSQGVTITLSGQAATATAGSLSTARAAALSGTVATMLPGNVGMPGNANPEFDLLAAICRIAPRGTRLWRACRAAGYPVR